MRRIAIVEDDPAIRANTAEALRKHGFEVAAFAGREEALAALRSRLPELAIIDIGLGADVDGGFSLCRDLRALSAALPIIFLTARDSDFDVVSGLRLGADDYLTKPFAFEELLARIEALLRRGREQRVRATTLQAADLVLDRERMEVTRAGKLVQLTAKELAFLELLMAAPGRVYSRERILSNVWGTNEDPLTNIVDVYVRRLRAKIDDGHPVSLLKTVRGLGYRLDAAPG
jgi:DNA-binding response OmpR family regulator